MSKAIELAFEQKTLDEAEFIQKCKRDAIAEKADCSPALPTAVAMGLPRDILTAYMNFCRMSPLQSSVDQGEATTAAAHECDSSCFPLISYRDTVFICRRSGNIHVCTMEYCEHRREELDHEKVFCPLTFNQFALNTSVRFFEHDGEPTESYRETDTKKARVSKHKLDAPPPACFLLQCPSSAEAADSAFLRPQQSPSSTTSPASIPARTWGVPIPRPAKVVHKRSRSALEASSMDSNEQNFVIKRVTKRTRTSAELDGDSGHNNSDDESSRGNGNRRNGDSGHVFVNVRSQKSRTVTSEGLRAAGASLLHGIFAYLKIPISENFVSWLLRVTLVLLAEIDKYPPRKKRKITYYFEEHLIVVMLEMKQGLRVDGLQIVPQCPFVARTFPDTRNITLMGSVPSWRGRTRKHLLAVITQQLQPTDRHLLAQTIAKLGVFDEKQ